MITLKGDGFILRPLEKRDMDSLIKNISDKIVYNNTSRIPHPYTKKDFFAFLNKDYKIRKQKNRSAVNFIIDIKGNVIGGAGIDNIDGYKGEIGYWIAKNFRNKGIVNQGC